MNNKNTKNKYQQLTEDKDFDGDIEEEYELDEQNIYKIENRLESKLNNIKKIPKNNQKLKTNNHINKSKSQIKKINSSLSKKINKNIKEKEYIETNISNSIISDNSLPKSIKSNSINNPHIMSLEININNEMKNKINKIENSNIKLKEKKDNIFDITYNNTNSSQLDNSEFLLNKLKSNKLLQELKLKESIKNKFRYYGKESSNDTNNNDIVFNISDNKNDLKEQLNKSGNKKKNIIINNLKVKPKYSFKCECMFYCRNFCRRKRIRHRNRRLNIINIIRNIFVGLVIFSAIGFYSIIFFYSK